MSKEILVETVDTAEAIEQQQSWLTVFSCKKAETASGELAISPRKSTNGVLLICKVEEDSRTLENILCIRRSRHAVLSVFHCTVFLLLECEKLACFMGTCQGTGAGRLVTGSRRVI